MKFGDAPVVSAALALVHSGNAWLDREMDRYPLHPSVVKALDKYGVEDPTTIAIEWPHLSNDGVRVAYTQNIDKGQRDIQTVTTPGKYLRRHFAAMKDHEVRDLVALADGKLFGIAKEWQQIRNVIENGPPSCMAYGAEEFASGVHPYKVYAPRYGWGLAWRLGLTGTIDGRALVYENDKGKCFVRSFLRDPGGGYSHSDHAIEAWLISQGYERHASWPNGAKLLRISHSDGRLVLPYLDGNVQSVEDRGDYVVIDEDGNIEADNQDGLSGESEPYDRCEDCGAGMDEDEGTYIGRDADRHVCDWCLRDSYTHVRGYRREQYYVRDHYSVTAIDGENYDEDYLSDNGIVELEDGRFCHMDDAVEIDGDSYHESDHRIVYTRDGGWQFRDTCFQCAFDDKWYMEDTGYEVLFSNVSVHKDNLDDYLILYPDKVEDAFDEGIKISQRVIDHLRATHPDIANKLFPQMELEC